MVVRQLTVAQVDAVWTQKRQKGYSSNSIRIMRAVLRRALAQAERQGLVIRNVAALSAAPRIRAREGRALSVEQARGFLASLRGERYEVLVTLMLAFGLRRGEALGLHWSAFDEEQMTIRVTHKREAGAGSSDEHRAPHPHRSRGPQDKAVPSDAVPHSPAGRVATPAPGSTGGGADRRGRCMAGPRSGVPD